MFYVIFMGGFVIWVASAWAIHYFYYLPKVQPKKLAITEYPSGTFVVYRVSSQSLGVDETCQVRHAIFLPGKLLYWRT